MKKRVLSLVLAMVLIVGLLPSSALAAEPLYDTPSPAPAVTEQLGSKAETAPDTGNSVPGTDEAEAAAQDMSQGASAAGLNLSPVVENDTTAPILTDVIAIRTAATSGTVTFTTNETGIYEVQVLAKGAAAPTSFQGEGTACDAGILAADITLTAAEADVYVLVKDASANLAVSEAHPVAAPRLGTYHSANRISDDTAEIYVFSPQSGIYAYTVVDKNAAAPSIAFNKAGDLRAVEKTTISITGLTSGAEQDVYVDFTYSDTARERLKFELHRYETNTDTITKAQAHLAQTLDFMLASVPAPIQETTAGDWTVMTLARGEAVGVPAGYYEAWKNVVDQKMIELEGVLHRVKYTEYSRLLLPLTALGYDPTNVGGYNIFEYYANLSKVTKQGINGPIWALIALDLNNRLIPADAVNAVSSTSDTNKNSRAKMIEYILNKEIVTAAGITGGCALTGKIADPDMTAMAIQALLPYYKGNDMLKAEFDDTRTFLAGTSKYETYEKMISAVKAYVDRGIEILSVLQQQDGDYNSWGTVNLESTAQVVVSLTGLGIDLRTDPRFIKNGKTLIDGMMKYAIEGGGFSHSFINDPANPGAVGGAVNAMATDQGGYALVALDRFIKGKNWLYDMTDVTPTERPDTVAPMLYGKTTVTRASDKATVKFYVNEPGRYYFSLLSTEDALTGEGTVITAQKPQTINQGITLELPLSDVAAKTLYLVLTDVKEKDAAGNSRSLEIAIPAFDLVPPTLTNTKVDRLSAAKATVRFDASTAGAYYYKVVDSGAEPPVISTAGTGQAMQAGANLLTMTNLSGDTEKDLYLIACNADRVPMNSAIKITIPPYVPSGDGKPETDEYAADRAKALEQLDKAFFKCSASDYTADNWTKLKAAYESGKAAIKAAKPTDAYAKAIYNALNAAIAAMDAVPIHTSATVTIAVSMDANTLGLGYLIKPTLVTVPKYTKASQVITDLLRKNGYAISNTGTVEESFYLAGISPVDQTEVSIPAFIQSAAGNLCMDDKADYELSEFDYFNMSGWMYSVGDFSNGGASFPGVGSSSWRHVDGEVMRWQFTVYGYGADLNADNSSWGTASIVNVGDKSTLTWAVASLRDQYDDKVLEANQAYTAAIRVLTNPEATQSAINSAEKVLSKATFGSATEDTGSGKTPSKVPSVVETIKLPATVDKNGSATATLSKTEANKALDAVKKNAATELVIAPEIKGQASKVAVTLPKDTLASLSKDTTAALTIQSNVAKISLPTAALAAIASESGSDVSITAEKADTATLSDDNKALVGDHPLFNLSVRVGTKAITKFNGAVTVSLPYTPTKGEDTRKLTIYYLDKEGKAVEMAGAHYDTAANSIVFETPHFSAFAVVYDENKVVISFTDVTENDWFYDGVKFVVTNKLFSGTSYTTFSPKADMSRAMLFTVLHRMSGKATEDTGDTWYTAAMAWAMAEGISDGTTPASSITREQMATMLYRYASKAGCDVSHAADLTLYTDSSKVSNWSKAAMEWAVGAEIMTGRTATTLVPDGTASRAEVAVMMQRFLTNLAK